MCKDASAVIELIATLDATRSADTAAYSSAFSSAGALGTMTSVTSVVTQGGGQKRRFAETRNILASKNQTTAEMIALAQRSAGRLRCSLNALQEVVQVALVTFMLDDKTQLEPCGAQRQRKRSSIKSSGRALSGAVGVCRAGPTGFKACMNPKALRIYTGGHLSMREAVRVQGIFSCVKRALRKASDDDPLLWEKPAAVCDVFKNVFSANDTSEQGMDLKVLVSLRAEQWLGRKLHITSPVMSLDDAVRLQARMLSARSSSWSEFRSICVETMASKKNVSASDAARYLDYARGCVAARQVAKMMQDAMMALRQHAKSLAVLRRQSAALSGKARKARAVEKAARRKKHGGRWQWLRRRDLTMQELLQGFPAQLRAA